MHVHTSIDESKQNRAMMADTPLKRWGKNQCVLSARGWRWWQKKGTGFFLSYQEALLSVQRQNINIFLFIMKFHVT